jgi:hypothetical protein
MDPVFFRGHGEGTYGRIFDTGSRLLSVGQERHDKALSGHCLTQGGCNYPGEECDQAAMKTVATSVGGGEGDIIWCDYYSPCQPPPENPVHRVLLQLPYTTARRIRGTLQFFTS